MTILDAGRDEAMAREEAARDEDFWDELMPRAAELVLTSGQATPQMLQRKMRIRWATIQTLLAELAELGVVGPDLGEQPRRVLLGADALPGVLAAIAGDPEDEPAPVVEGVVVSPGGEDDEAIEATNLAPPTSPPATPVVVLTKTSPPPPGDQGGEPATHHPATPPDQGGEGDESQGGELAIRPDDEVATWQPGELEPWRPPGGGTLGGRVQETWWRVIDHPATTQTKAVTRQLPKAGGRLLKYTPRGIARLTGMTTNALFATHTAAMVARIADTDPLGEAWVKASAEHGKVHERLATRRWLAGGLAFLATLVGLAWWAPTTFAGILAVVVFVGVVAFARGVCRNPSELATCVAVAAGGAAIVWFTGPDLANLVPRPYLPWWGWAALVMVGVAICGWHGRHEDQPLIQAPHLSHKPPPITASMVIDALCRIGVPGMTLAATDRVRDEIRVRAPGVGHSGRGYTIELELPPGVTAASVMENREELAGALRRKLGCVWPSRGPDHPGHLRLFLSHVPMATAPQPDWPHAGGTAIDSFEPFELVTDQEGEWVKVQPAGTHTVIAGASGFGKSVVLRHLAVALAFDPRARLYCFDGKISGDLDPIRKIAHAYYEGAEEEDVNEQLQAWRDLEKEMRRRAKFLRNLPPEERSSKVTSTLATKYPHLAPVFVLVDECQEYTEYGTKGVPAEMKLRAEFRTIITRISRLGRSAAIHLVLASQKPDAEVLPTAIMGNCSIRLCFKVTEQNHNDQVLGTGAYKQGLKATLFSTDDRGLAWLKAAGDPQVVRGWSQMVDLQTAYDLIDIAYRMRAAKGLLTGQAADDGIEEAEVVYDIVEDAERVMSVRGCGKAQWGELVVWLQELRPGQYAGLTEKELSAAIHGDGIRVRDVRSSGSVKRGVYISDLRKVAVEDDE